MNWRGLVLRVFKVPPTPAPPPGSVPRTFRAAQNYFTLRMIVWGLTQLAAAIGLVFALYGLTRIDENFPPTVLWLIRIGEAFAVVALLLEIIFGWMLIRLDYELRWYLLSDRAIRIREGIATVREKTIALANIQNISIRQGPLQRMLGIADVEVRTAGGGEEKHGKQKPGAEPMHVAYFRGVDDAAAIRDLLREAVSRHRDTGLGDPDEEQHAPGDANEAALLLLDEARKLRAAVS
ncbi:MAG TPA: PH domain-containing protein [Thermoanaerobaculia bacterium]|jgi:uncharacterized membrane protein YdbT with pleckstrin-like domain